MDAQVREALEAEAIADAIHVVARARFMLASNNIVFAKLGVAGQYLRDAQKMLEKQHKRRQANIAAAE